MFKIWNHLKEGDSINVSLTYLCLIMKYSERLLFDLICSELKNGHKLEILDQKDRSCLNKIYESQCKENVFYQTYSKWTHISLNKANQVCIEAIWSNQVD